jgi:hypothetical protein
MLVGGHSEITVDLCVEDNFADSKSQYLGKGQTTPTNQTEFEECWSEVIVKNSLSLSLVDDSLFRKDLVTTDRMGQSVVYMDKGTVT